VYAVATAEHGRVVVVRANGTNTAGGAWESIYVALVAYRDEKVAGYEFFEPEDLDTALAHFEALGAVARPTR
jgi:ketosteroid isomerase-like protein